MLTPYVKLDCRREVDMFKFFATDSKVSFSLWRSTACWFMISYAFFIWSIASSNAPYIGVSIFFSSTDMLKTMTKPKRNNTRNWKLGVLRCTYQKLRQPLIRAIAGSGTVDVSFRFQGTVPSAKDAIFLGGSGGMLPRKILKIWPSRIAGNAFKIDNRKKMVVNLYKVKCVINIRCPTFPCWISQVRLLVLKLLLIVFIKQWYAINSWTWSS